MYRHGAPTVLLVDDDDELSVLVEMRLNAHGYEMETARSAREALASLASSTFDAVLLDVRLADDDGLRVLSDIRKRVPDLPVIILTAHGTIELAVDAMQRGAFGFITKPFHSHDLLQKLAHAVEAVALRREVAGLRKIVGGSPGAHIVGASPAIEAVRNVIARIAPTEATVLLTGESGTGKELAAQSIHHQSSRSARPFIAVNCAALPADLLESELFGHVRGSFTGAVRDRDGVFAAAAGGSLFLDEIGDASLSVQAKLLRVLQERRFTRVGSSEEHLADVRIIAATNRDLRADVAAGRFREDLLFRIRVIPIRMPALRERLEDVPLLADVFLDRAAARHARPRPTLSPGVLDHLLRHSWPGNVRELANVVEAALLFAEGPEIQVDQLDTLLMSNSSATATNDLVRDLISTNVTPTALPTLREVRDSVERAYLHEVLRRTDTNVSAAARLAGRNRSDFYELLRKHGISKASVRAGS